MEHPNELPCRPPKWKNQILKDGARRCVYKKRQCTNDYMDINNARMWIVDYPIITKDESYKDNINKGYTILKWNTMQ